MGLLISALARHRQGDSETSHSRLAEATKLIDSAVPRLTDGTIAYHRLLRDQPPWLDWLNAEILRREAAALLAATPAKL